MAVIAAFKFDDVFASGKCARYPQRRHGGFRSGADKTHLFQGRKRLNHRFRQLSFYRSAGPEARPIVVGAIYRLNYLRMRMPQDQWSPRAHIVDVLIAVSIPDVSAFALYYIWWITGDRFKRSNRGVDPAGNNP